MFKQNSEIIWDKDSESTFQKFKEKEHCINKTKLLPTKYGTIEKKSMILINYLNLTSKQRIQLYLIILILILILIILILIIIIL